jgi:hypothetical protein
MGDGSGEMVGAALILRFWLGVGRILGKTDFNSC